MYVRRLIVGHQGFGMANCGFFRCKWKGQGKGVLVAAGGFFCVEV